jgi:bisphosphoglycerate-dependent phosphoglycerate mutase
MGKNPLCMTQFYKILSACRIPGLKKDSWECFPPDEPNSPTHITVIHNNSVRKLTTHITVIHNNSVRKLTTHITVIHNNSVRKLTTMWQVVLMGITFCSAFHIDLPVFSDHLS